MNQNNTDQFITKAVKVHGDKYTYEHTDYIHCKTKVKITCPVHGLFEQRPTNHLSFKQGCPRCGEDSKKHPRVSVADFIKRCAIVHNNKYQYTNVQYNSMHDKIEIVCSQCCGKFTQRAYSHVRGQGCPICGTTQTAYKKTKTTDQFITKATEIHGNKYNYTEVVYTGVKNLVKIICPTHGIFEQTPNDHIHSHAGCPQCNMSLGGYTTSFFDSHPDIGNCNGWLYWVHLSNDNESFYKIGITKTTTSARIKNYNVPYNVVIKNTTQIKLKEAFELEQYLLMKLCEYNYKPHHCFGGHTECLIQNDEVETVLKKYIPVTLV